MNEKIVIYPKKTRVFSLLLGSVVLILGGVFIKCNPDLVKWFFDIFLNPRLAILMTKVSVFISFYGGVPFFSFGFVYLIYRLISSMPSLIINKKGLSKTASVINVGIIYWREIKNIFIHSIAGQKFLRIEIANPEDVLGRLNFVKRFIMKMNFFEEKPFIDIPQSMVSRNLEQVLEIIENYKEENENRK